MQVFVLYSSTIIGLFLGVISSVINTHALLPKDYGDYQFVQNIIAFISGLLLLGYFVSGSRLLAISKDELFSRKLRGVLILILILTNVILMISLMFFYLYSVVTSSSLTFLYLYSIPLCGNIIMASYINTVSQGDNQINRIALARVIPIVLYIILAVPIYHCFKATPELMLFLYNGSAILVLFFVIYSTKPLFKDIISTFKVLHNENKLYGFNVYIGSVFGVSTQYVAGITLGMFGQDNANVGFYTLALTMASPLALLPGIIGTTYFKRFANEPYISNRIFIASLFLAFLSCIIFCAFIDFIVELLYSDSYNSVSTYAKWLSVGMCFHGLGDMLNRFLGAHGQGKQLRNSAFLCGLIIIVGSFTLVRVFHIEGAVYTRVFSSLAYMFILYYYYRKYIRENTDVNKI